MIDGQKETKFTRYNKKRVAVPIKLNPENPDQKRILDKWERIKEAEGGSMAAFVYLVENSGF